MHEETFYILSAYGVFFPVNVVSPQQTVFFPNQRYAFDNLTVACCVCLVVFVIEFVLPLNCLCLPSKR